MGSGFLFPQPGILSGAARSADLWGQLDDYNICPDGQTADFVGLWNDWATVGSELWASIEAAANDNDQLDLFEQTDAA